MMRKKCEENSVDFSILFPEKIFQKKREEILRNFSTFFFAMDQFGKMSGKNHEKGEGNAEKYFYQGSLRENSLRYSIDKAIFSIRVCFYPFLILRNFAVIELSVRTLVFVSLYTLANKIQRIKR